MTVTVRIPTPLRAYAKGQASVTVSAANVGEALRALAADHGELRKHLFDESGALRPFVAVYVNGEDVRHLQQDATPVKSGDTLVIVPAVAGGQVGGGRSVASPYGLTRDEIRRYSRHLILPDVGLEGQRKLKEGRVLVIGTGGLGSPVALYLAAAGVGTIGLVDFDVVDETNLQRQILFSADHVGKSKVQAAKERLLSLNPGIEVVAHEERLTSGNALRVFADYDVIVDGTDNFPTRYLTNDACVLLGKPNVYGSIFQFEGQASVFWAEKGPCYRCLYPQPPPPGLVPSCAEGGVLGVLPGVVGAIQATEALKLLLGKGDSLVGRLILYDALGMTFTQLTLRKNAKCPACGTREIRALIDYEEFCGLRGQEPQAPQGRVPSVTATELAARLSAGEKIRLVDVRNPNEWEINRIEGATLIPLPVFPERVNELSTADEIVVYCHTGMRSMNATKFLLDLGFRKVRNLHGGIAAWGQEVDPEMPMY
ncbi:MAG TPA: ubiquitin-like small modifier protein 1 [Candidatus Thermoplasmatota archaeon]|nr:ubiquitin-like small modifier protein 1 [Candidatus Thermoplasmatota archaeon]